MADQVKTNRELDAEIIKQRHAAIESDKTLSDDDKKILIAYDKGTQTFQIAKDVFKFVNNDTVGTVVGVIRKAHADDYSETEKLNDYKGYTGV